MKEILHSKQMDSLKVECLTKSKLRTFMLFKEFDNTPSFIMQTLNFHNRRQFAKLRLGCLPLQIELGRYHIPKIPENLRFCKVCLSRNSENKFLESEIHFLFICRAYNIERQNWLAKMILPLNFSNLPDNIKLSVVLNDHRNVKLTSQFIVNSLNIRNKILIEF